MVGWGGGGLRGVALVVIFQVTLRLLLLMYLVYALSRNSRSRYIHAWCIPANLELRVRSHIGSIFRPAALKAPLALGTVLDLDRCHCGYRESAQLVS